MPNKTVPREFILSLNEPVVFNGMIDDWEIIKWGIEDWAKILGENKQLPFRSGVVNCSPCPLWERKCVSEPMTIKQFQDLQEKSMSQEKDKKWHYFDYKYAHEWISEESDFSKLISWTKFGLSDYQPSDSTIWIGSQGAHTPCHYDTYGCNLVAQVKGTKRWILFPPTETTHMKPTRVPYEESSVYSKWNFSSPLPADFYDINRKVYIVDLKAGQVLFVPPLWWHYVESLETSITVNIWPALNSDHRNRLEESLVRLIMAQISKNLAAEERREILNPNASSTDAMELSESIGIVNLCVHNVKELRETAGGDEPPFKKNKLEVEDTFNLASKLKTMNAVLIQSSSLDQLKSLSDIKCTCLSKDWHQTLMKHEMEKHSVKFTSCLENVVNALCHPDVIAMACAKLINASD